jgi:hypothetical protein
MLSTWCAAPLRLYSVGLKAVRDYVKQVRSTVAPGNSEDFFLARVAFPVVRSLADLGKIEEADEAIDHMSGLELAGDGQPLNSTPGGMAGLADLRAWLSTRPNKTAPATQPQPTSPNGTHTS